MCCLFGFIDCGRTLSARRKTMLIQALAAESEARGTDAAGIAYNSGGKLRLYKRPGPARKCGFRIPDDARVVMGHSRMTTQGKAKYNKNNHPFSGKVPGTRFALAHNGVLYNDHILRAEKHLPHTGIQTDSYVAVQLLEQDGRLDAETIGNTAARLEGSFSLTILNQFNHLYLVKGNSPLCIYRFESGLICYASTADILKEALARCSFLSHSKEIVSLSEGDILCIRPDGRLQMSRFDTTNLGAYDCWMPQSRRHFRKNTATSLDALLETACNMGFLEDDVFLLLEEGFDESDIEELLNMPGAFYDAIAETVYARMDE